MSSPTLHADHIPNPLPNANHSEALGHAVRAVDRLNASRMRLRQSLSQAADPPYKRSRVASTWLSRLAQPLMARLRSFPVADFALNSARTWWQKQPLRTAAYLAFEGANVLAKPVAKQRPAKLLLSAFAGGAALAWARPWRMFMSPSLLAVAAIQVAAHFIKSKT